jgi:hypothetical protein
MMPPPIKKLWTGLIKSIAPVRQIPTRIALFNAVRSWFESNRATLSRSVWQRYGIDGFLRLDASQYPLEHSQLDVDEELDRLEAVEPTSEESLVASLRDILWSLLVAKSETICSRCKSSQLSMLLAENMGVIVLTCDLCGWAQLKDGREWSGGVKLQIATQRDLMNSGFL